MSAGITRNLSFFFACRIVFDHTRMMQSLSDVTRSFCCFSVLLLSAPCAAEFAYDGDISVRYDDASDRSSRSQYRFRLKPQYSLDNGWSFHGFIATGDEFESAYNTIDDDDDELHIRRLFARYADGDNKVEVGVIPPYKGRVSSTGLSKEGWIRGVRVVRGTRKGAFEVVVGDLEDLRASRALGSPFDLSYLELEYSARINQAWSFEIGGEEILEDRFVRGEVRYTNDNQATLAAEVIHNTSTSDSKVVLSTVKEFSRPWGAMEWFTYYTYTGSDFGRRAELSEDFLDVGHALATILEGPFSRSGRFGWFAELEIYEDLSRIKLGIEISLN